MIPTETIDLHRGVHHGGLAAPVAADARGRKAGVRQQLIRALAAQDIPLAQLMQLRANQGPQTTPGQGGLAQVGVHLIPGVAHGGMDIAQMALVRTGQHTLGHQMAAAEHQGVTRQIELLNRHRQQRQVLLNVTDPKGQALHKGAGDRATGEPTAAATTLPIHQGKQLGLLQQGIELLHHQFRAAHRPGGEPLVHQGDRPNSSKHGPKPKGVPLKFDCPSGHETSQLIAGERRTLNAERTVPEPWPSASYWKTS